MCINCAEYFMSESPRNDVGGDQKHDFWGEWPTIASEIQNLGKFPPHDKYSTPT